MTTRRAIVRAIYSLALLLSVAAVTGMVFLIDTKTYVFNESLDDTLPAIEPFPVGVNHAAKIIVENPEVEVYFSESLASKKTPSTDNWKDVVASVFSSKAWYQSLASPVSRIMVIWPGERHEQVVKHFGDILRWNDEERAEFANLIQADIPVLSEGKFFPGKYVAHRNATPKEIALLVSENFETQILERYTPEVENNVSIEDALTIASLIEREASDFENMREISGVIWNRLFINMPLQLDATLQYARGSRTYEPKWWPVPRPQDKYINSAYNTYQNEGLPPGPIANPSTEAVLAALNPRETDCLFYFHANNSEYYCSENYDEHVSKLRAVFGQGR